MFNNVIANSTGLPDAGLSNGVAISDYWGGTPGIGNAFHNNDSFNNPGGVASVGHVTVTNNITSDPQFTSEPAHDFTISTTSPVYGGYNLWNGN